MNVTYIYCAAQNRNFQLKKVSDIVTNTLSEMGIHLQTFDISEKQLPLYNNQILPDIQEIVTAIHNSEFVVFAFTTELFGPVSNIKLLLEHFQNKSYGNFFTQKKCLAITVCEQYGEQDSIYAISKMISYLGGNCVMPLGVYEKQLQSEDEVISQTIEKHLEDVYRIVTRKRNFFPSSVATLRNAPPMPALPLNATGNTNADPILELDQFTQKQQQDIQELTDFFAKKLSSTETQAPAQAQEIPATYQKPVPIEPREKTCKQLTQNLIHYYQPQIAGDLNATYQINVSGNEEFQCSITVQGLHAEFYDGANENADLIIISDSAIWREIMQGKYNAQKAFMTGQLKVRGNFVLLNKFDQLFKIKSTTP